MYTSKKITMPKNSTKSAAPASAPVKSEKKAEKKVAVPVETPAVAPVKAKKEKKAAPAVAPVAAPAPVAKEASTDAELLTAAPSVESVLALFDEYEARCDAQVAAATLAASANNTYNITKSHSVSLLQAAEMIVKIVGAGSIECRDRDADFPSRGALNIDKARRVLGFDPRVDVQEGFENYYHWLNNSVYWSPQAV